MSGIWSVTLDGVTLTGDSLIYPGIGEMTVPIDGLGHPDMRTEDVTLPQRDGVRHFNDWYGPRIITIPDVWVCPDTEDCDHCPSAREKVRQIMRAWSRKCDDAELVIRTDCWVPDAETTAEERALSGPYAAIGRPRVAQLTWVRGRSGCAVLTLRFDAVDQRLYVLDADGTPGSGVNTITLDPASRVQACRTYPRCYGADGMCYDETTGGDGAAWENAAVYGDNCAYPIITLVPGLTSPEIENLSTGQTLRYLGNVVETPVIIDTFTGTATQGGADRTYLLAGTTRLALPTGVNSLRLLTGASGDSGYATIAWRDAVESA